MTDGVVEVLGNVVLLLGVYCRFGVLWSILIDSICYFWRINEQYAQRWFKNMVW